MFRSLGWMFVINILIFISISAVALFLQVIFGFAPWGALSGEKMVFYFFLFLVLGFMGSFTSLFLSKQIAKGMMRVQIIEGQGSNNLEAFIVQKVNEYSVKANLPKMPEVGVFPSQDLNAFATGPSKSNSLVAVSSGLLNGMSRDEIEGVLAHEVTHIANGDMVRMTLIQGVINTFVGFLSWLLTNLILSARSDSGEEGGVAGGGLLAFGINIVLQIVFSILGSMVAAWFSRRREFRADQGGAELSSRGKMVAALKKLQMVYEQSKELNQAPEALATFQISSQRTGFLSLFRTHPPLQERIDALMNNTNIL